MKKVLIADDDCNLRNTVMVVLESEGFWPLEAADGLSALNAVQTESPDVAILDLNMPKMDGIETLREIRKIAPDLPVIILTGYGDIPLTVTAMKVGAYDFIEKPPDFENLIALLKEAAEMPCNYSLTTREKEILEWVREGKSNVEISMLLGLSENTVRSHLKKVFQKLDVCSRAQAVAAAFESGILRSNSYRST